MDEFVGVPLKGAFQVYDTIEEVMADSTSTNAPRYAVLCHAQLEKIMAPCEGSREDAMLFLMPHRLSPLFYMNSSGFDINLQKRCAW